MNNYPNSDGCPEFRNLSRRRLLRKTLPAAAAAFASTLPQVTFARGGRGSRDTMVIFFLRGGMDGLTTCVPYGDPDLYTARPNLAIPPPGQPNGAIDLDGFFGLAPSAAPLLPMYQNGHLAFVHASGSPNLTQSHFDAETYMEYGIPELPLGSVETGWMARHLLNVPPTGNGILRGVALAGGLSETLHGAPATLPIRDFEDFTSLPGSPGTATRRRDGIIRMYEHAPDPVGSGALDTLSTLDIIANIDFDGYRPENGADYGSHRLGSQFKNAAALIKADVGAETIMITMSGWDLHAGLGPIDGSMAIRLDRITKILEAFYLDMLSRLDNVVVLVMTEFGRRVGENGSMGTDHGYGSAMMAIGGGINGGQVLTQWPGLSPGNLHHGNLRVTTDYRDIVAEIAAKRLENPNTDNLFPNYTPTFHGIAH